MQAEKSMTITFCVACLCFEELIGYEKTKAFATLEPKTMQIIPFSFSQQLQKVVCWQVCVLLG